MDKAEASASTAVPSRQECTEMISTFDFLAAVFLTLPDEAFIESILALELSADTPGASDFAAFVQKYKEQSTETALLDAARDRAKLLRGIDPRGIKPPYESQYRSCKQEESMLSLNQFYREAGFELAPDAKEATDQIGIEFSFMAELYRKILSATDSNNIEEANRAAELVNAFYDKHLGAWASEYGKAMADAAETGLYRGIGKIVSKLEAA